MRKTLLLLILFLVFSSPVTALSITSVTLDKNAYEPGDLARVRVTINSDEQSLLFPELRINGMTYKMSAVETIGGEKTYSFLIQAPEKEGNYDLEIYLLKNSGRGVYHKTIITVKPRIREFLLSLQPRENTAMSGEKLDYALEVANIGSEKERIILKDFNLKVIDLPRNYVEVMPGELPTLESEILRLGSEYGIDEVESTIGRLQDLYWKVIGVAK